MVFSGRECGGDRDKVMVVVKALYGLKSLAKAWRNFFAKSLDDLGYKSCPADPDVYMKPEAKADGTTYYSYLLVYVDGCKNRTTEEKHFVDKGLETGTTVHTVR